MAHEFPRRRNLASLKKEAKRWLVALGDNVVEAKTHLARALPNARAVRSDGRGAARGLQALFPAGVAVNREA